MTNETDSPVTESGKPMTQTELFKNYLTGVNVSIDSLDWTDPGKAHDELQAHIRELEGIAFEVKKVAVKAFGKLREKDMSYVAKVPKPKWEDKPSERKKVLSKVEKAIQSFLTIGYSDEDVYAMFSSKMAQSEIRVIIAYLREKM